HRRPWTSTTAGCVAPARSYRGYGRSCVPPRPFPVLLLADDPRSTNNGKMGLQTEKRPFLPNSSVPRTTPHLNIQLWSRYTSTVYQLPRTSQSSLPMEFLIMCRTWKMHEPRIRDDETREQVRTQIASSKETKKKKKKNCSGRKCMDICWSSCWRAEEHPPLRALQSSRRPDTKTVFQKIILKSLPMHLECARALCRAAVATNDSGYVFLYKQAICMKDLYSLNGTLVCATVVKDTNYNYVDDRPPVGKPIRRESAKVKILLVYRTFIDDSRPSAPFFPVLAISSDPAPFKTYESNVNSFSTKNRVTWFIPCTYTSFGINNDEQQETTSHHTTCTLDQRVIRSIVIKSLAIPLNRKLDRFLGLHLMPIGSVSYPRTQWITHPPRASSRKHQLLIPHPVDNSSSLPSYTAGVLGT
ncbi:unnamed protein product, partial [Nesidiocoris tenuis]